MSDDAELMRSIRARYWSDEEWLFVPPPTQRIQSRGCVGYYDTALCDHAIRFTHEASGCIEGIK